MNNYLNSEKHKTQFEECSIKGRKRQQELKEERIVKYNLNPNQCKNCNNSLSYKKKNNKFCSKSCANSFSNRHRKHSKETKSKISNSLRTFDRVIKRRYLKLEDNPNYIKVAPKTVCKICKKEFEQERKFLRGRSSGFKTRKTCSRDCQTIASTKIRTYQNGSRKTTWFYNPFEEKDVLLESSWEVKIAELLIDENIKWVRPEPIKWFDSDNKSHLYYPDFYLSDYNVYLDPKNPYCMDKDIEKMKVVSKEIDIVYGDLKLIERYIKNIHYEDRKIFCSKK